MQCGCMLTGAAAGFCASPLRAGRKKNYAMMTGPDQQVGPGSPTSPPCRSNFSKGGDWRARLSVRSCRDLPAGDPG